MRRSGKTAETITHIVVNAAIEAYRERVQLARQHAAESYYVDLEHIDAILVNEPTVEDVLDRARPAAEAARSAARAVEPKGNRRERREAAARARKAAKR